MKGAKPVAGGAGGEVEREGWGWLSDPGLGVGVIL